MSPRKVRLVVDMVRGMDAAPAIDQLKYLNKAAARPVRKLLESAVANASHNDGIEKDNLVVKAITVNDGPTLKRYTQRAMGASGAIRKRTSHVTVTLAAKDESKVAKKTEKKAKKAEPAKKEGKPAEGEAEEKPAAKKPVKREEKVEKKPAAGKPERVKKPVVRKASGRKK